MFFIYPHNPALPHFVSFLFSSSLFPLVNSFIITLIKIKTETTLKLPKPTQWTALAKQQRQQNKIPSSNPTTKPEPSSPPQDVKCHSPSSTSILVRWWPPPVELQNGIITQYTIQYGATEGEDTTTHQISSIPPESSRYLLENLEKWTEYRVTVTAHTDVGAGPESLPLLIRTEEDGMFSLSKAPAANPVYFSYSVKY